MNKEICFLEGAPEIEFTYWYNSLLGNDEYEISEITNLYKEPEKLHQLKEKNPWGIFIGTTGIRHQYRKTLIETFLDTGYLPTAIIFADEDSALCYADIARDLKENADTISYKYNLYNEEIIEIEWI